MHPVALRGLAFDSAGRPRTGTESRPVVVERSDPDFIAAFVAELETELGRKVLAERIENAGEPAPGLKLLQPVHRTFYLAVFEAACETFGDPRLDPADIESAGLVVRRIAASGRREAWIRRRGDILGWVELAEGDEKRDPDPARRPDPYPAGHPILNERLRAALGAPEPDEEAVSLLFTAPPDACAAAGRTVVYGLVPLASGEHVSPKAPRPRYDEAELREHLSPWFVTSPAAPSLYGVAGKRYTKSWADEIAADVAFLAEANGNPGIAAALRNRATANLQHFETMLRTLHSVFNAFEDKDMLAALDRVELEYAEKPLRRPAGQALRQAAEVFVLTTPGASFIMPARWPRLSEAQAAAITRAASTASDRRIEAVAPRRGRFDEPEARYELRAFLRVKRDDGCPPAIVWSEPSRPFDIAAWHENGKLPPLQISLPRVTPKNIKSFLPNVAFSVPKNIFNMLSSNKPEEILKGNAKEGSDGGFDWICGFNIPIITLCAFIVLSIFLVLLHIVFWWLPFVRICIPVPKALTSKLPEGTTS